MAMVAKKLLFMLLVLSALIALTAATKCRPAAKFGVCANFVKQGTRPGHYSACCKLVRKEPRDCLCKLPPSRFKSRLAKQCGKQSWRGYVCNAPAPGPEGVKSDFIAPAPAPSDTTALR